MKEHRALEDLISVGPATLKDFKVLGISTVEQLARQDPWKLYQKLMKKTGKTHDICVFDVFTAAVEQARNTNLPQAKKFWVYWSKKRKKEHK